RQHRNTAPERVGSGGVCIDRQRVEKQISMADPSKVGVLAKKGCKDDPLRVDAALGSLGPNIAARRRVQLHDPQHPSLDLWQQARPDIEDRGRDFVAVVEGGKYEAMFRKPKPAPR